LQVLGTSRRRFNNLLGSGVEEEKFPITSQVFQGRAGDLNNLLSLSFRTPPSPVLGDIDYGGYPVGFYGS